MIMPYVDAKKPEYIPKMKMSAVMTKMVDTIFFNIFLIDRFALSEIKIFKNL